MFIYLFILIHSILKAILAVDCGKKESIYGFHGNTKILFLRITVALPKLIAPCKRILEGGFKFGSFPERGYSTYESNVDFEVCMDQINLSTVTLSSR